MKIYGVRDFIIVDNLLLKTKDINDKDTCSSQCHVPHLCLEVRNLGYDNLCQYIHSNLGIFIASNKSLITQKCSLFISRYIIHNLNEKEQSSIQNLYIRMLSLNR